MVYIYVINKDELNAFVCSIVR